MPLSGRCFVELNLLFWAHAIYLSQVSVSESERNNSISTWDSQDPRYSHWVAVKIKRIFSPSSSFLFSGGSRIPRRMRRRSRQLSGGAKIRFCQFSLKPACNWKNLDHEGDTPGTPLDPPMSLHPSYQYQSYSSESSRVPTPLMRTDLSVSGHWRIQLGR